MPRTKAPSCWQSGSLTSPACRQASGYTEHSLRGGGLRGNYKTFIFIVCVCRRLLHRSTGLRTASQAHVPYDQSKTCGELLAETTLPRFVHLSNRFSSSVRVWGLFRHYWYIHIAWQAVCSNETGLWHVSHWPVNCLSASIISSVGALKHNRREVYRCDFSDVESCRRDYCLWCLVSPSERSGGVYFAGYRLKTLQLVGFTLTAVLMFPS